MGVSAIRPSFATNQSAIFGSSQGTRLRLARVHGDPGLPSALFWYALGTSLG